MLDQFTSYLMTQGLCVEGDRVLLAVSGGVDSVVMAHLFSNTDHECAIAHCNFQLRGEESDAEEAFVRSLAATLEMPVYVRRFDVEETCRKKGISVQMAARELRYCWFEELLRQQRFDVVATAHNLNDSVETFLLNLTRGTGIRGLTGIPPRNENVIRPLLFASRPEIAAYASGRRLAYREDSSNIQTKYSRNKIRHDVIPVMEMINPVFIETMNQNMNRLKETHDIFLDAVERTRERLFERSGDRIRIRIPELKKLTPVRTWLFELFSPFGFTRSQCEGMEKIMEADPGRRSISTTHQLFKDRDQLILTGSHRKSFDRYYLDSPENVSNLPFPMDVEVMDREKLGKIPDDNRIACLDYDLIQFPLTIRHWYHGDYFFPLGMDQMKKLSDFFVDQKIPVPEKERIWVLASGKKIVWIMGYRIDNRFKITEKTRKVLLLRFQTDVIPQPVKESV
ncbi:MAG: tRNA lysidine(34) synthetase TilS [Bacteroidota bacterium]